MKLFSSGEYWIPFLWGLTILAAWVGWGEVIRRALGWKGEAVRVDWGLLAGWGMSAMLAMGGWLAVCGLCNQTVLMVFALGGAAVWVLTVYAAFREEKARRRLLARTRPGRWIWFVPVGLLALFLYATSVRTRDVNWWDDLPAYMVFSRRFLQTGTLLDAFSWRRLSTYGGQQMLDAMVLSGSTLFNIDLLEMGLARVVFAGLLVGMVKGGRRRRIVGAVVVMVLLLVPVPRVNTQSQMTGVVLFLTLLRTLLLSNSARALMGRAAFVAGVVGAAVSTMRMNFVPAAVLGIGGAYGMRALLDGKQWRRQARGLLLAAAGFVAGLLPWAMVLFESSRSLFFPLMHGTERPEFTVTSAGLNAGEKLRRLADFCVQPASVVLILPALLLIPRRFWRTGLPLYVAALATMVMTVMSLTRASYDSLYRYCFPALFASVCAVVLVAVLCARVRGWVPMIAGWAAVILVAAFHMKGGITWLYQDRWGLWFVDDSPLEAVAQAEPAYLAAQRAVPAGKKIFAAVSFPNLLDYARNPIVTVDTPGAASPEPGMPIAQGGAAVKAYLKGLGIEYMILVEGNTDRTMLSRRAYVETQTPEFDFMRPFTLKFLDDMDELLAGEDVLYADKTLRVIQLK